MWDEHISKLKFDSQGLSKKNKNSFSQILKHNPGGINQTIPGKELLKI